MKMLLHACCGPCSLEPTRLLLERGCDIVIAYANANISPREEYDRRLFELQKYANSIDVEMIEGSYNTELWESTAGKIGDSLTDRAPSLDDKVNDCTVETVSELLDDKSRQSRCRACYRMRLEEAARIAVDKGCDTLATTLAVSPYQFTDIINEELSRAAAAAGLTPYFEDWRPYYDMGTARSREMNMYRQGYCGCRFSIAEGEATRAFIRKRQAMRKQAKRAARENELTEKCEKQRAKAADRREYNEKQARKRAILKAMRQARINEETNEEKKATDED